MNDSTEEEIDFDIVKYTGNYPKEEIKKGRKQIYDDLYRNEAHSLLEIIVKRKCGILTQDVADYYLHDICPSSADELTNSNFDSDISLYSIEINQDKSQQNDEKENKIESPNKEKVIDNKKLTEASEILDVDKKNGSFSFEVFDDQDVYENSLVQVHLCEKKVCLRNIKICSIKDFPNNRIIYICDFCHHSVGIESNMLKHLKEADHYSASEYIIDSTNNTSVISGLISRSSVRNVDVTDSLRVFCPKCNQCFDNSTLACGIHYEYIHSGKNEYIYSLGKLKREESFEIGKKHICIECDKKFKKLTDLIVHIDNFKHFPSPAIDEINVFECPFDDCSFTSIHLFTFKTHLLTHKYYNKPKDELCTDEISVKLKIYSKPTGFMHIPQYRSDEKFSDKKEELNAIDSLLDILKGHPDTNDQTKRLKQRKDHLHKSIRPIPR